MAANVMFGYLMVALAICGILYITVFHKGPEAKEEFVPRYGKSK